MKLESASHSLDLLALQSWKLLRQLVLQSMLLRRKGRRSDLWWKCVVKRDAVIVANPSTS